MMNGNIIDRPADDVLVELENIAAWLGEPPLRVRAMLLRGELPGYKLGNRWHLRKSTYFARIAELEQREGNAA